MITTSCKGALWGLAAAFLLAVPTAWAAPPAAQAAAPAPPAPAAPSAPAAPAAPKTPAAAPAAGAALTISQGPLVPGVCLLSEQSLIGRSKVGQAAGARLRELTNQVQANLNAEKARLDARGKALAEKRATLTPLQMQAESEALNRRAQALQAEAGERSQQLDATKTKALGRVIQDAQPYIVQAYGAHGCGLLFAREAVLSGNLGNDLTDEVLANLDAKATPVSFDLEPARK